MGGIEMFKVADPRNAGNVGFAAVVARCASILAFRRFGGRIPFLLQDTVRERGIYLLTQTFSFDDRSNNCECP
jgi:hypothetical protein